MVLIQNRKQPKMYMTTDTLAQLFKRTEKVPPQTPQKSQTQVTPTEASYIYGPLTDISLPPNKSLQNHAKAKATDIPVPLIFLQLLSSSSFSDGLSSIFTSSLSHYFLDNEPNPSFSLCNTKNTHITS